MTNCIQKTLITTFCLFTFCIANCQENQDQSDAQLGDSFSRDPFSNTTPFNDPNNLAKQDDNSDPVYSDTTTNIVAPNFFKYLNTNSASTSDGGDDPDRPVPLDDNIIYLFIGTGLILLKKYWPNIRNNLDLDSSI